MKAKIRIILGAYHYLLALGLFALPWLGKPADAADIVPSVIGAFLLVSSALASFELGIFRLLSYKEHLYVCLVLGLTLVLFSYSFTSVASKDLLLLSGGMSSAGGSLFAVRTHHVNRHKVQLSD